MFKGLKQKIAKGQEGVSPGRQTPLRPKREVGKAQAQNNGILDQSPLDSNDNNPMTDPLHVNDPEVAPIATSDTKYDADTSDSNLNVSEPSTPIKEEAGNQSLTELNATHSSTKVGIGASQPPGNTFQHLKETLSPLTQYLGGESNPSETSSQQSTPASTPLRTRLKLGFSALGLSTPVEERSDTEVESDTSSKFDQLSREDMLLVLKKQGRALTRYKSKFSEVVDSYKTLAKEKEKLENALTTGQDKHLRRISELKETVELEKRAKEHLEETLRMSMEEKDEMIHVLHTQVQLLKSKKDGPGDKESGHGLQQDSESEEKKLQGKNADTVIASQKAEIEKLKSQSKEAREVILRLETEKKTAIAEMLENVQGTVTENSDLKASLILLKDEVQKKDKELEKLIAEQENMRANLTKELKGVILEEAILRQEKEVQMIYQKKEEELKTNFTEKVREIQQLVEEKETQKRDAVAEKDNEIARLKGNITTLDNDVKGLTAKLANSQNKTKKVVGEKEEWEKKFYDVKQKVEQEQARIGELVQQHNNQLKEKQDEMQQQISKSKKMAVAKVHELQEQLKKQDQKILEVQNDAKRDLENHLKQAETTKQTELSKISRTYDTKVSDLKKAIKDLRGKSGEKDDLIVELEGKLNSAAMDSKSTSHRVQELEEQLRNLQTDVSQKKNEFETVKEKLCREKDVLEKELLQNANAYSEMEESKKKEISDLTFMLESKEKLFIDLQHRLDGKENELLFTKNMINNYEGRVSTLEKELEGKNVSISTLEERNTKLHEEKESEVTQLKTDNSVCMSELQNRIKEMEEGHKTEIDRLKEVNNENLSEVHGKYTEKIESLESQLHAERENAKLLETMRVDNDALKCDNGRLRDTVKSLENSLEAVKSQKSDAMANECNSLRAQLQASQKEFDASVADITKFKKQVNCLEARVKELQERLNKERVSFEEELKSRKEAIENVQDSSAKEMALRKGENEKLTCQLEKIKEEYNIQINEKENDFKIRNGELERQHKESKERMEQDYETRLSDLKANYDLKICDQEKQFKVALEEQVEKERAMAMTFEEKIKSLSQDVLNNKELSEREAILQSQINSLLTDKKNLELSKEEERASYKEASRALEMKLEGITSSHAAEISSLQAQNEAAMDDLKMKHNSEILSQTEKFERIQEEKTAELLASKKTYEQELSKLQKDLQSTREQITVYESKAAKGASEALQSKEQVEQEFLQKQEAMLSNIDQMEREQASKLQDCNRQWKSKCDELEKKYRKIIADKERKRKDELEKSLHASREQLAYLESTYESKISKIKEEMVTQVKEKETATQTLQNELAALKDKLLHANTKSSHEIEKLEKCLEIEKSEVLEVKRMLEESKRKEEELVKQPPMQETKGEGTSGDVSLLLEQNKVKLQEMKRKAENKIMALKKSNAAAIEEKDKKISELQSLIDAASQSISKTEISTNKENNVTGGHSSNNSTLQEDSGQKGNQIRELESRVTELQEKIEYAVVDKMQALKTLESNLKEEHHIELEKIKSDASSHLQSSEAKLQAKIDEKEFEYSARVKQIVKEFQAKLDSKEQEIHDVLENAVEKGQKEERKIIDDYEDQIMEYKRELKLRDDDMKHLKDETEKQLETMRSEMQVAQEESKNELIKLQTDYHKHIDDMARRQESELQKFKSTQNVGNEDYKTRYENQISEIEESYHQRLKELENQHQSEKQALEKKFKMQLRKNQSEMKKLLADKGVIPQIRSSKMEELDSNTWNSNSDTENDAATVPMLKEKITAMSKELEILKGREKSEQINLSSSASERASRPATLNICQTPDRPGSASLVSPPKTPEPVQYEYLRNVLFEYMMGRQKKQLSKVLAAIVHFSPSQVQQIIEKEEHVDSAAPGLFG